MKRLKCFSILLLVIMLIPTTAIQAKNKKDKTNSKQTIQTTGAQDRAIWVKLMWKISYPVIHNLAENTLRQNMPIESPQWKSPRL